MVAFCFSLQCAETKHSSKPTLKLNAKFTDTNCPDCKSILKWGADRNKVRNIPRRKSENARYI